jgi:hypothetical protein
LSDESPRVVDGFADVRELYREVSRRHAPIAGGIAICYEQVFVTSQGSPLTRLRRALAGGDLLAARKAAADLRTSKEFWEYP